MEKNHKLGRPKKDEVKKKTVMQRTLLLASTKEKIQSYADSMNLTESDIVRLALSDWFRKMERRKKK
ncbi:MAG: hypothetical protein ACW98F_16655 [Candidatus Hodarchaeales archaeon]|jgi:hypothetical protein